jgi:adenylate cyclase
MSGGLRLRIYESNRAVFNDEFSGPVELGRQDKGEQGPFARSPLGEKCRLIIASHSEDSISRQHALLEPVGVGSVRIRNLSARVPIRFADEGDSLPPGESREFTLPSILTFGRKTIRILPCSSDSEGKNLQTLSAPPSPPGSLTGFSTRLGSLSLATDGGMSPESVIRWLQATMGVLQAAAGTTEFLERAARAVVELVGLDTGRILIREKGDWREEATAHAPRIAPEQIMPASRFVLRKIFEDRRTFWEVPNASGSEAHSLDRISAVVAAPILNRGGEVIGVLYGDRNVDSSFTKVSGPISMPEAMLVEVLAGGVSAGLERVKQEKKAVEAKVLFEQFFTPELARQILDRPDMLESRESNVTLLFCDIRGFSRISEKLGPGPTMEWVNDVMGTLSDCVNAHDGVLVDYIGDELLAMWGAPKDQPDHALLACRAAIAMVECIPAMNERWKHMIEGGIDLGIGINTGAARVGNTGTKRKFKYGPLGNSVNLASRLQGATKYFKTRLIISGYTHAALGVDLSARRLGWVRVVNISEPVELYELAPPSVPGWETLRKSYCQGLEYFESENFNQAAKALGILQLEYPNDGPSLILLSRVVNAKVDPESFDRIWTLPSK